MTPIPIVVTRCFYRGEALRLSNVRKAPCVSSPSTQSATSSHSTINALQGAPVPAAQYRDDRGVLFLRIAVTKNTSRRRPMGASCFWGLLSEKERAVAGAKARGKNCQQGASCCGCNLVVEEVLSMGSPQRRVVIAKPIPHRRVRYAYPHRRQELHSSPSYAAGCTLASIDVPVST